MENEIENDILRVLEPAWSLHMTPVSSPCVFLHTNAIDRPWTPEGRIRAVRITLGIPSDPTSSSSEHRTGLYFPMFFSFKVFSIP